MTNPFASAVENANKTEPGTKKKKGETIIVDDEAVASAIDDYQNSKAAEKEAKASKEAAASTITPMARSEFITRFAEDGQKPETMKFRGNKHTVQFIVQDRSGKYAVNAETEEMLRQLIGEKADSILEEQTTFSFDTSVLQKPGVMEKLGVAMQSLVEDETLTKEELSKLLVATPKTVVKEGILDRVGKLCDFDAELMENVLVTLGSNVTMYPR